MNHSKNQVVAIDFRGDMVYLQLADGRMIGNPLAWHPWLEKATPEQRANVELYELSAYWIDLDEGLDVEEMMKGIPPRIARKGVKIVE